MATGKTIFITYLFEGGAYQPNKSYGFSTAIHCNYINKITTDSLNGKRLSLFFEPDSSFPFMATPTSVGGTGFTATGLSAIVQVVDGIADESTVVKPVASGWSRYDITNQIANHTVGDRITPTGLTTSIFSIDINNNTGITYTLDYLNYPVQGEGELDNLTFGEEAFFFGTVRTDVKATVYSTDIPITLQLNQYNTTTNPTWNGNEPLQITEIGIYDDVGNLVGIGKLNFPISKDSTIARTIVFGIDF